MTALIVAADGRALVLVMAMVAVIVGAKLRDDADKSADWCTHCDGATDSKPGSCPHCHGTGIEPNNGVTPRPIDDNDPSGRKIVLAELGIKAGETA